LIRIVAEQRGIDPALVEKDYWIMHSLYGLQKLGLTFELKGGTSLSKGFKIIDRFSEDIGTDDYTAHKNRRFRSLDNERSGHAKNIC
jgi:predicted nucleotidyltransferase component of viral defense system